MTERLPWNRVRKELEAPAVAELLGLEKGKERDKWGPCPSCGSSETPALTAYPGSDRGFFCFSCNNAWTVIDMAAAVWGIPSPEACERLARVFGIPLEGDAPVAQASPSLTIEQYAEHFQLDPAFLAGLGVRTETDSNGREFVEIPYPGSDGSVVAIRQRISLNGGNRFRWRRGDKPCLYGLPRLKRAREAGYVVLVEGESDCHVLWFHEYPAVGLPGATQWKEERDAGRLEGIETVYVIEESDQAGKQLIQRLAKSTIAEHVRVVRLKGAKDPAELYLKDRDAFAERFKEALEAAVPIADQAAGESRVVGSDLFQPYTFEQARADLLAIGDGVSTGFAALDRAGFVLAPGNLYTYAGRQGGGKTALLIESVMRHVEATPDACALFVSFEGHRAELIVRLLLRQVARHRVEDGRDPGAPPRPEVVAWLKAGAIPYSDGRPHGVATSWEEELARAREVLEGHLRAGRLVLIDGDDVPSEDGRGAVTVSRLVAALKLAPKRPTVAVFDYFQKVAPDDRSESRYLQLAGVSDRLRRYSKGDGDPRRSVPVLTAAQVNREAGDRQPGLEHIRETDDLGNDGVGVVTIRLPDTDDPVKRMSLAIVKNRHGVTGGRFDLHFHGACGYFAEVDPEAEKVARTSATTNRIRTDVARYMADHPDASTREIRENVSGRAELVGELVREIRETAEAGNGLTMRAEPVMEPVEWLNHADS